MPVTTLDAGRLRPVQAVEAASRAFLERFDPDAVFLADATALFEAFDRVDRLWASAKALLAHRVEAAATWRRGGYRSTAEQIAGISGTSVAAARTLLEVSKQVDSLPATAAALRAGDLSLAKAEVIAGSASIAPDAEAGLLATGASLPLAELREEGLRARAGDRDATYERIRRRRTAREHVDAEGAWNFFARGTADAGARFRADYDPIVDEMFERARSEGRHESRDAYAFDALIELARRASGGGEAVGPKKSSPKFLGLIRVDHEALRRGAVEGDEVCEIAGLGPIPTKVARELLGEAILKLVITRGVDVANVTHLGRSPTRAQQVALWWRSSTCEVEGCTRTRRLENDHSPDWAESHHTRLRELRPFCDHHHDLKTLDGWDLTVGTGRRPMVPPGHPGHPRCRPPPDP